MARTTVASLNTRIAALEARLVVATKVYHDQKERIAELEAALNTRGCISTEARAQALVRPATPEGNRRFVKHGQLYERVPVGFNTFAIRPVLVAA